VEQRARAAQALGLGVPEKAGTPEDLELNPIWVFKVVILKLSASTSVLVHNPRGSKNCPDGWAQRLYKAFGRLLDIDCASLNAASDGDKPV